MSIAPGWGHLVLRLVVGAIFVAHGLPMLVPVLGGSPAAAAAILESSGLSPGYPLALVGGLIVAAGGFALIVGAFTTIAAAALSTVVIVAAWKVHLAHGFYLNWRLAPGVGHGYEYDLALVGALVCLVLAGPGRISLDERRARRREAAAAGRARLRSGSV